jgi:hypothetical protein
MERCAPTDKTLSPSRHEESPAMTTRIDNSPVRPLPFQKPGAARLDHAKHDAVRTKPLHAEGIVRGPAAARPADRTDGGGAVAPGSPLTPEGLQAAWGQTDSEYDLNRDRVVDIDDMVQLILEAPRDGAAAPAPAETAPTADGFAAVWGQDVPAYDLDANNVVDIDDLVQHVLSLTPAIKTPSAPTPVDGADTAAPTNSVTRDRPVQTTLVGAAPAPSSTDAPLTIDGLREAWGQSGTPYDFDRNGTVDIDDLVRFVMHGAPSEGAGSMIEGTVAAAEPAATPRTAQPEINRADRLARSMITRLRTAGFSQTLPTNLGDLLDKLDLNPGQKKAIANRLDRAFPNGVGVNKVG